jgi:hypothetical protein
MDERSLRSLRAPFQEGILVHAKKHLLKRSSEDVMKDGGRLWKYAWLPVLAVLGLARVALRRFRPP